VPDNNGGCSFPITKSFELIDLFVPNIFTPNTDNMNETFEIRTNYPLDLRIFNRWGKVVEDLNNYQNDWAADGLSSGVYYYEITFLDGGDTCTGWVHVLK